MMYESPIEKIYGEIQTQIIQEDENMIMKAIRNVGINVDKDELIKALQYDRNQYTKGYADGKNDMRDKIYADIQRLRGCSCSSSDGIIDDIEDILDKYEAERRWQLDTYDTSNRV